MSGLTRRIPLMLSPEQVARVDDWRFEHRFTSRAEAVRSLIDAGLQAEYLAGALARLMKVHRDMETVGALPGDKGIAYGAADAALSKFTEIGP